MFTSELLTQCRVIGREQRLLVRFTWIGENLRLDAQARRMELAPTPDGIVAVLSVDGTEIRRSPVNPEKDDAAALVRAWLK